MYRLRRLFLSLLVWLTAAMTLVAGSPHFSCRCPDGRVRLYCFGSPDKKTGCCCGGSCCGKSGGCCRESHCGQQALATTCCGEHTTDKPAQPQKTDHIVAGGCCTKFPAQPNPATLSLSSNTHITKGVAFGLLPISDGSPSQHLAVAVCRQRQDHERPPPTDLVIALQHFLI